MLSGLRTSGASAGFARLCKRSACFSCSAWPLQASGRWRPCPSPVTAARRGPPPPAAAGRPKLLLPSDFLEGFHSLLLHTSQEKSTRGCIRCGRPAAERARSAGHLEQPPRLALQGQGRRRQQQRPACLDTHLTVQEPQAMALAAAMVSRAWPRQRRQHPRRQHRRHQLLQT